MSKPTSAPHNVDAGEIDKFSQLAHKWWDETSEFKPLHDINPLRLGYIDQYGRIGGKTVLDVGCGGGILTESMAKLGAAHATGIDMAEKSLKIAKLHALDQGVDNVAYRCIRVEDLAAEAPHNFDVVTCMEMMEHVPDPAAIVAACARLVKPDGTVFFSTINQSEILSARHCGRGISAGAGAARHARLAEIHHPGRARAHVPQRRPGNHRQ